MKTEQPLTIAHKLSCNAHFIASEGLSFWSAVGNEPVAEWYRARLERVQNRMTQRKEAYEAERYKEKLEGAKEWQRAVRQLDEAIETIEAAESFARQLGEAIAKAKQAIGKGNGSYPAAVQNLVAVRNSR